MRQLFFLISVCLIFSETAFSQRGKEGNVVISAANTTVNTYTSLTASATIGATSITVANNTLAGGAFTGNLTTGDLIMIVQMQGIRYELNSSTDYSIDIHNYPLLEGWPYSASLVSDWDNHYNKPHKYGKVEKYYTAGNFELREVSSVSGGNQINLTCPLEQAYSATEINDRVQVIRVPRYNNLTVQPSASIIAPFWNGTTGGTVSVEVDGNLILNGTIDVSGRGFRGGALSNNSNTGNPNPHTNGQGNGSTYLGYNSPLEGAAVGESIFGNTAIYSNPAFLFPYGRGAIANGGGGGGIQNAGGGGGSNVGDTTGHTGKGIPTPGYNSFWNEEKPNMATTFSSGGGRGGYSYANAQGFGVSPYVGPNNADWGGNSRKEEGGFGGHALLYNPLKMFFGGGGGAGGQDSGQGGAGGNGGGIVFLTVYGTITGSGSIVANGTNGQNSNPNNESTSAFPASSRRKGNDGAGGGGGGGYIYVKNSNPIPSSISLTANGGNGGTHALSRNAAFGGNRELCGPGAGGAGGGIAYTLGTPTTSIVGGLPGGTTDRVDNGAIIQNPMSLNFPMNGATSGGVGLTNLPAPTFDIIVENDTICGSQSTTLTASVTGTLPSGGTIGWYTSQFGGAPIATGTTFNTPVLASTTTYYVGVCPGTFRKPVTVVVGSSPAISGTAIVTDATCTSGGSITGLSASGGTGTLTYNWNGTTTADATPSNASAGNYTLTVTDENGCSATSGPYEIEGVGGPTISGTPVITPETCSQQGTITGLIVNSSVPIVSYEWNTVSSVDQNLVAGSGSYTLTVTDQNGCTAQSGPHTIGGVPTPSISGTVVITNENCNNGGIITGLSVSGGTAPYTYSWNGTSTPTPDLIDVPADSYTLTVTDANDCEVQSGPHQINADPLPVIDETTVVITNGTCTVPLGSIEGLTVNGGIAPYTYEWNGASSPSIDLTNVFPDDYVLTVTDANGCSVVSSSFSITAPTPLAISGTPVITDATCTQGGSITGLSLIGGTAPYTYEWNGNATPQIDLTNASGGSYTLVVSDANGCEATSGPHVIGSVGVPVISGTATVVDATCQTGGSISGLSVSGGTAPYTYEWNGDASASIDVTNLSPDTYTLVVEDANGCIVTSTPFVVGAPDIPIIGGSVNATNANCLQGGSITGIVVTNGTAPYVYEWNPGGYSTLDVFGLPVGTYTLTVTDANGCVATGNAVTIVQDVLIDAQFSYSPNPVLINEQVHFHDESVGNIVLWNWDIDTSQTTIQHPIYTFNQSGFYDVTLTVTDANGCIDSITITIEVISDLEAPNVITANGDGVNDLFVLKGLLPNTQLLIVNRWGNLIYTSDNYDNTWGGKDMTGKDVAEGVYTYRITLPDGNQKHGFVHIVRSH